MDEEKIYQPIAIEQEGERGLRIRWADDHESVYLVRDLRLACGCASCVDEWSGQNRLDPDSIPEDIFPRQIHAVGRYAIQFDWSDGHNTGIFNFKLLRKLSSGQ